VPYAAGSPQAGRYLIGVAGQRGAPAPLRAALLSRRHVGQQLHVDLGSRSTCNVGNHVKTKVSTEEKEADGIRFGLRLFSACTRSGGIPNAADVVADHTLRLAGRRAAPWLLLSAVLPGDLSHQCHFHSPLPQRSRKNCCTCRSCSACCKYACPCCNLPPFPQFGAKASPHVVLPPVQAACCAASSSRMRCPWVGRPVLMLLCCWYAQAAGLYAALVPVCCPQYHAAPPHLTAVLAARHSRCLLGCC
jgi:hypothetical protein